MKKIIALLLVAVMCFSLTACGGDKETSNNREPQTNSSETQQETDKVEENNEATINIAGTWVSNAGTLTINEDGTGKLDTFFEDDFTWEVKDNALITMGEDGGFTYEVIVENETISILEPLNGWKFVSEETYKNEIAFLVGTWKDDETTLTISDDGTGHYVGKEGDFDITWKLDESILRVYFEEDTFWELDVIKDTEVVELKWSTGRSMVLE